MVGHLQPGPARADTARGRPNVATESRVSHKQSAGTEGRRGGIPQDRIAKSSVGAESGHREVKGAPVEREDAGSKGRSNLLPEGFALFLRDANQPGHLALAEFSRAPAATQQSFWAEVRKRTEAEQARSKKREEEATEAELSFSDFNAAVLLVDTEGRIREAQHRIWGKRWRDRAYRDRAIEERGRRVDDDFDAEKARLEAIEAVGYVFRLTGAEPNRAGYVHCPLPGHDERTPSFHCKDTRWRCYGCGCHGSIYELAGILWNLPRSGRVFHEIHRRLAEVFDVRP